MAAAVQSAPRVPVPKTTAPRVAAPRVAAQKSPAVQTAAKKVVTGQKPASKTALEKAAEEYSSRSKVVRDPNFLAPEVAQKLVAFSKARLARIAKTRNPNLVFVIVGKSDNENTVVYMGKLKAGTAKLTDDGPCAVGFWINYGEKGGADGSKECDFSFLEKQVCYGFETKLAQSGEAIMTMKALESKPMRIRIEKLPGETKPRIVARGTVCGVPNCRILSVYATVKTGLIPGVEHVDIVGEHPKTGAPLAERLKA